jgi:hypothetical protein
VEGLAAVLLGELGTYDLAAVRQNLRIPREQTGPAIIASATRARCRGGRPALGGPAGEPNSPAQAQQLAVPPSPPELRQAVVAPKP